MFSFFKVIGSAFVIFTSTPGLRSSAKSDGDLQQGGAAEIHPEFSSSTLPSQSGLKNSRNVQRKKANHD